MLVQRCQSFPFIGLQVCISRFHLDNLLKVRGHFRVTATISNGKPEKPAMLA